MSAVEEVNNVVTGSYLPRDADVCMEWKSVKDLDDAVDEGRGFGKKQHTNMHQGDYVISLPKTLFTAIAAFPTLCMSPNFKTVSKYILYVGPLFIMSVFTVIFQLGSIWYVFDMNGDTRDAFEIAGVNQCKAPDSSYFLRLICVSVFVTSVFVDLKESAAIAEYLRNIPTINKGDLNDEDKKILDKHWIGILTKRVNVTGKWNPYNIEVICCGGLSTFERLWFWLWTFLKVAAEVLVLFVGAGYVVYADSNENLILNSVALLFITQIDDIVYNFAVTDLFKSALNGVPDIGKVYGCNVKEHKISLRRILYPQLYLPWFFLVVLFGTIGVMDAFYCL